VTFCGLQIAGGIDIGNLIASWQFASVGGACRRDRPIVRHQLCDLFGTEMDLAADLVARRIVSLPHHGRAVGVKRAAVVCPDDDVTTILESGDMAIGLGPRPDSA
jgi:hypothetical protein